MRRTTEGQNLGYSWLQKPFILTVLPQGPRTAIHTHRPSSRTTNGRSHPLSFLKDHERPFTPTVLPQGPRTAIHTHCPSSRTTDGHSHPPSFLKDHERPFTPTVLPQGPRTAIHTHCPSSRTTVGHSHPLYFLKDHGRPFTPTLLPQGPWSAPVAFDGFVSLDKLRGKWKGISTNTILQHQLPILSTHFGGKFKIN